LVKIKKHWCRDSCKRKLSLKSPKGRRSVIYTTMETNSYNKGIETYGNLQAQEKVELDG